jgi:hypothetical protein
MQRRTLKPFITPSASSMPRTESLRPTTMMGLRSASIVGVQDVVLVRRSCFRRSSSRLTLQSRSSPMIFEPSLLLARQTRPFVPSGRARPTGVRLVLLPYDLRSNKSRQIGGRGWFCRPRCIPALCRAEFHYLSSSLLAECCPTVFAGARVLCFFQHETSNKKPGSLPGLC